MCIIVDNNVRGELIATPRSPDCAPILDWLMDPKRDGVLVYGAGLESEYDASGRMRRFVVTLRRAERAYRALPEEVDAKEAELRKGALLRSDDPHVIALARVTGARVLFTHDRDLVKDFTDPRLVAKPRGKVYQKAEHAGLLKHSSGCPWTKDRVPAPKPGRAGGMSP